ncbi:hypothetical protein BmHG_00589 [Borrelia miyamotoi]|nr:hypothetical protein BmHH_00586 [Borrelia miyamotoi]BCR09806.1 hypothetical protein BmHG_00589 [Borrelia miyamotoi]BCR10635.1 hypothetical protein BmHF_00587 [Borrelia miyamotoi]BCR11465.1 hypothetical protein BmHI_00588 [Borrelia miyamotoi]BCR12292.1 hypothetical protein BmHA_00586 [Borrelia miyamotoi]
MNKKKVDLSRFILRLELVIMILNLIFAFYILLALR